MRELEDSDNTLSREREDRAELGTAAIRLLERSRISSVELWYLTSSARSVVSELLASFSVFSDVNGCNALLGKEVEIKPLTLSVVKETNGAKVAVGNATDLEITASNKVSVHSNK